MKDPKDISPTPKQPRRISPRFVGTLFVLLLALVAVVSLSIFSTRNQNVALSAARSTSTSAQDAVTPTVQATPMAGAVKVDVTLSEFHITSSVTDFKVGTPYYFVVTNAGRSLHEFFIMPDKPNGSNYLVNGQYNGALVQGQPVKPGTTLMVNYTFKASNTTHYEIACLMRGHYAAGMSRPIIVK